MNKITRINDNSDICKVKFVNLDGKNGQNGNPAILSGFGKCFFYFLDFASSIFQICFSTIVALPVEPNSVL